MTIGQTKVVWMERARAGPQFEERTGARSLAFRV
jgi:hypothetical protein